MKRAREEQPEQSPARRTRRRLLGSDTALPDDLIGHLITFLDDDGLFGLRGVSRRFRGAYANQNPAPGRLNGLRVVRVARLTGLRFPRLDRLRCTQALSAADLGAITPQNFPRLTKLLLPNTRVAPQSLPANANLTDLYTRYTGTDWTDEAVAQRYPSLRLRARFTSGWMIVYVHGQGAAVEPDSRVDILTILSLLDGAMDSFDWGSVSREAFPQLQRLRIPLTVSPVVVPDDHMERLREEGIRVELT